jgi:hypothetical protein
MKCMEIWTPGADLRDYFLAVNIPNIRVQYANQLFFSSKNTADKSLVNQLFREVILTFFKLLLPFISPLSTFKLMFCYVLFCRANFTVSERV